MSSLTKAERAEIAKRWHWGRPPDVTQPAKDINVLLAHIEALEADFEAAQSALKKASERLTYGKVGELEDEVDEALHVIDDALQRLKVQEEEKEG